RNDRIDMALSYQEIGQTQKAAELLVKMAQSESRKTQAIGPGAFFKERGRWAEAITQFQLKLEGVGSASTRSLLEFEIGHAFDRQYKWTEARHWFQRSLVTEGTNAYRHYRLRSEERRGGKECRCRVRAD